MRLFEGIKHCTFFSPNNDSIIYRAEINIEDGGVVAVKMQKSAEIDFYNTPSVLFGYDEENEKITLANSFSWHNNLNKTYFTVKYSEMYIGGHFEKTPEIEKISFEIENFCYVVPKSQFVNILNNDVMIKCKIDDMELSMFYKYIPSDNISFCIDGNVHFSLESKKTNLINYILNIHKITDFAKFVAGESFNILNISFIQNDVHIKYMYANSQYIMETKKINLNKTMMYYFLPPLQHISKVNFVSIFTRWFEFYSDFSQQISLYLCANSTIYSKRDEFLFIMLANCTESYHRNSTQKNPPLKISKKKYNNFLKDLAYFAQNHDISNEFNQNCDETIFSFIKNCLSKSNEMSFLQRINKLLYDFYCCIFQHEYSTLNAESISLKLSKDIRDSRNYYTHYSIQLKKKALKGLYLSGLSCILFLLLKFEFLKKLGYSNCSIRDIIRLDKNFWIIEQVLQRYRNIT